MTSWRPDGLYWTRIVDVKALSGSSVDVFLTGIMNNVQVELQLIHIVGGDEPEEGFGLQKQPGKELEPIAQTVNVSPTQTQDTLIVWQYGHNR